MPQPPFILDPEQIDLDNLRVFDLVMRNRSVSDTADVMGVFPGTVSRILKTLEERIGEPLFIVGRNTMIPTERALLIEEGVRSAIGDLRRAVLQRPSFDAATSDRGFKVDIPVGGHMVLAPLLMAHIDKTAPNVRLIISSSRAGDVWPQLQAGEVDLAMDYVQLPHRDVRHQLLYDDPFVVIARRGHPAVAAAGGLTREVFETVQHVAVSWTRTPRESPVDRRLGAIKVMRRCKHYVPSIASIPGIVESTDYVAMLSRRTAQHVARRWAIEVHPCPFEFEPIPIHIVWHARYDDDPGHTWLRDALAHVVNAM